LALTVLEGITKRLQQSKMNDINQTPVCNTAQIDVIHKVNVSTDIITDLFTYLLTGERH